MDSVTRRFDAPAVSLLSCLLGLLGLAVGLTGSPALAERPPYAWANEDTRDECQLSTSPVPGKGYFAAKSTCLLSANIEVVGAVLRDIERYPEWMEDCTQTKLLKVVDQAHAIYVFWYRQHIPVFTDRDLVLRSALTVDQEAYRVVDVELATEVPYDSGKGYLRMPSFHAQWVLEKVDEQHTRVTYLIDPDLGPGLPVGLANSTIAMTPFKSLRNMMKMVRREKYLDAAKAASASAAGQRQSPAIP